MAFTFAHRRQSIVHSPGCSLSNAFPNGPVPITGNSLGGLTNVGFSTNAVSPIRKTYYDQQWTYGLQYAPTPNDVIDLTYVGNHSVHVLASGLNLNQLDPKYFSLGDALTNPVANPFVGHITSSGCGLDQPTVAQGQLLRPYPEFCDVNEIDDPAGDGRYNALDLNYTHRVSQGLTLVASYTFSKFLDNVGGPESWANASANFGENIATSTTWRPRSPWTPPILHIVLFLVTCTNCRLGKGRSTVRG